MKKFALLAAAITLTGCTGCEQVDTGYRGIETRFGEIQGEPLPEGLHFYNPVTSSIREMSVREEKLESKTECFTRDTQRVDIAYALTFYPDPGAIHKIYRQFGEKWPEKIIAPALLGAIKDTVGRYIADDLVGKRDEARAAAFEEVRKLLETRSVFATRLDFTNLDFDDAYEKAVEAKVVAVQKAAEARNKTVEIEERAKQQVIEAKAEAESMTIRSEALSKNKGLVEWEAVQALKKWNGEPPQVLSIGSGVTPFANLLPSGAVK